jgi:hypothetical protein
MLDCIARQQPHQGAEKSNRTKSGTEGRGGAATALLGVSIASSTQNIVTIEQDKTVRM